MFEVTYRVALKCLTRKSDGDVHQSIVRISRRAYLASKPEVGETVVTPFFAQHEMARFRVVRVSHCTHLSPPTALSYVPEFLGEITLLVEDYKQDTEGDVSHYPEEYSAEEWKLLFGSATKIGWTVDATVDGAHFTQ